MASHWLPVGVVTSVYRAHPLKVDSWMLRGGSQSSVSLRCKVKVLLFKMKDRGGGLLLGLVALASSFQIQDGKFVTMVARTCEKMRAYFLRWECYGHFMLN